MNTHDEDKKLTLKKILFVTAVESEKDAIKRSVKNHPQIDVQAVGVGPAAAAANTARLLIEKEYELVISAGIGGGFPHKAEVGSLVVANEIIAADLGAETPEGFSSVEELGFGSARIKVDLHLVDHIVHAFRNAGLPVRVGPVLTASTVTGTSTSAFELSSRVPGATAEAMEGFGVGTAAYYSGVPVLEIRAISNVVGPRDRAAWRIQEALDLLEKASLVLMEVLT